MEGDRAERYIQDSSNFFTGLPSLDQINNLDFHGGEISMAGQAGDHQWRGDTFEVRANHLQASTMLLIQTRFFQPLQVRENGLFNVNPYGLSAPTFSFLLPDVRKSRAG